LETTDFPAGWELTELRNLCEPDRAITYGILKPGPDTPDGVLYVRVADFPNDQLELSRIKRTTKEIDAAYARARLREGDILLSIRGTVGRVCIVPTELKGANITQDTARLTIQDSMDLLFVAWFLRAMPTQRRMQKAIKGVAIRGINIGDVRAVQVPIPPLSEQREIVRRVEALFRFANQIEARYRQARAYVDKLTQSILAKAFRGELVQTEAELARREGRDYESASALLERIRQEREELAVKSSRAEAAKFTSKKRSPRSA
jgi:type I restriction enzyme S subunit